MKNRFITYPIFICCLIFQISLSQQISDKAIDSAILSTYNDPDKAIETGNKLLENTKLDSKERFEVLILLFGAHSSKREYSKALDYALKAIEVSKKRNDVYSEAKALNKIATIYNVLGIDQKAIQYLDQAEKIISQLPDNDSVKIIYANNHSIRGDIFRDLLSCDIAIEYFNKAFEIYKINEDNPRMVVNTGIMLYNIGSCYSSLEKFDSAFTKFQDAIYYAQKSDAKILEAVSRQGISTVYNSQGKYFDAIKEIEIAQSIALELGDAELERESYQYLSLNYLALNDWKNHEAQNSKYLSKNVELKKRNVETVNHTISIYKQNKLKEFSEEIQKLSIGIISCVILILSLVGFWIFQFMKYRKQIKSLKSSFKNIDK